VARRPIAGQRNRARLGTGAPRVEPRADTSGRDAAPATAVLDRPAAPSSQDPAPAQRHPRRPGRGDVLVLVALALVVLLAATAVLLGVRARGEDRAESARSAALAAAEAHAVTLLSYDHRHLDRDFARAGKVLTGSFAEDYARTTRQVVRPSAEEVKAVVTAEVASASVVRASANRAVVLLFVDQTTTSTRLEGPKVDLNRVRMTLVRSGGQWLVSGVDAL
jgi:Mce-associated membrane protein